jgi:hypothetical protein
VDFVSRSDFFHLGFSDTWFAIWPNPHALYHGVVNDFHFLALAVAIQVVKYQHKDGEVGKHRAWVSAPPARSRHGLAIESRHELGVIVPAHHATNAAM